jgi:DNA-binding MarR family transcriptional regulator
VTSPSRTPDGALNEAAIGGIAGYRLAQAAVVTSAVFQRHIGQPQNLRPVEFAVLALASANPGAGAAQLARALAMSKPHMTLCLGRLEARRLVRRQISHSDGRVIEVHASAAGNRLVADGLQRLQAAEREALSALSPAELAMLLELLAKAARRP